jgi:hypothetical protein
MSGRVTDSAITLIPGDRVRFDGHEWDVLITPREQNHDSPIFIWRSSDEGLGAVDLVRSRRELVLVPRPPDGERR